MQDKSFPYGYWIKMLGIFIVVAGIINCIIEYYNKTPTNVNGLAMGLSWGFVFIFFSKERTDDEMMQGLKFKALATAVIVAFSITQLYNYIFLNRGFERHGEVHSISAYQFLSFTLILATGYFYYLKYQISTKGQE